MRVRKTRYEIWALFETGIKTKVETHKTFESAKASVDAMNHHNEYELSIGYGFPHGVPKYEIKEV